MCGAARPSIGYLAAMNLSSNTILVIEVLAFWFVGGGLTFWALMRAEDGYEDESGFHRSQASDDSRYSRDGVSEPVRIRADNGFNPPAPI